MFQALQARDLYLIAGCAATGSAGLAAGILLSDIALVAIDPRDAPPRGVFAATLAGVTPSPAAAAFVDALREAAGSLR
jgi:DNA-binding transcriptional LysR family regulator